MITAGIDMGSRTIKVVVLRDGQVVGQAIRVAGFDAISIAREAMEAALRLAGVARRDVERVVATGAGREEAPDKDRTVTDVGCAARAAVHLFPDTRTVIEVGAEEGRAIRCDGGGRVLDFAINEKCAAGAGAFTEAMARALEVSVEELGPLSLESEKAISINAQCVVFAESEVISLIHGNVGKADVARAVHDAMASRVLSMVRRVGIDPAGSVTLLGGLARNVGFVDSLRRNLEVPSLNLPADPELSGALGAALAATRE